MKAETISRITPHGVQRYVCVAVETYAKKSGHQGEYAVWKSDCQECGEEFFLTSRGSHRRVKEDLQNVRCPNCNPRSTPASRTRNHTLAEKYRAE